MEILNQYTVHSSTIVIPAEKIYLSFSAKIRRVWRYIFGVSGRLASISYNVGNRLCLEQDLVKFLDNLS